jgi:hypothetical protein
MSNDVGFYPAPTTVTRTYSLLRAPTRTSYPVPLTFDAADRIEDAVTLSYWQQYMRIVGRVAQYLLDWIGDDSDNEDDTNNESATSKTKLD